MLNSRELALRILVRVEGEGAFTTILLDAELQQADLDPREAALATELVYGVLRWRKTIDWYLDQVCRKPMAQTHLYLRQILRIGAYQLLRLEKIPPSAAVNEAVKLAGQYQRQIGLPTKTAKGFVNGALRALERSRTTLLAPEALTDPGLRLATQYSYPEWLVSRWIARLGLTGAETTCQVNNLPPALIVRANRLKLPLAKLRIQLSAQVESLTELPAPLTGFVLQGHPPIAALPAYQMGLLTVQNGAAMLIGHILDPQPGETILDACAGSGTKTTHLAELMQNQGTLYAIDLHASKLKRLQANCDRLGVTITQTRCGDLCELAAQEGPSALPRMDRVLLDAPCSGLGVLRRHPEAKWTKQAKQIQELQGLQMRLLTQAATLVRPNGVLVYSTCTTEPEETDLVIRALLQHTPTFHTVPLTDFIPACLQPAITPEGWLRIEPPQPHFDGFFCARLIRKD
jgi:16S rRNA (cytosine967-C5)-methyltransferase